MFMKIIDLTSEQKDKLLKMCKVLFNTGDGRYTQFRFSPDFKIGLFFKQKITNLNFIQWIDDTNGKDYKMHWFEFCLLHLAPKIIYPLYIASSGDSDEGGQVGMEEFGNDVLYYPKTHPVDYLYGKFLKLNNENI